MAGYVAKPYVAGTPEALIAGHYVLSFVENLEADMILPLLPKHGLETIDPEKWYPHQACMDTLKELSDLPSSQSALVAFGRKAVEKALMPPEITSIPQALHILNAVHHMNLRNIPEEEGYFVEEKGPNHYWVYHNTPNPEDVIYGFIWGMVARFRRPDEAFVVRQIENPNPDVHPGTVYQCKWGVDGTSFD